MLPPSALVSPSGQFDNWGLLGPDKESYTVDDIRLLSAPVSNKASILNFSYRDLMYWALGASLKSHAEARDGHDSSPHIGNEAVVGVVGNVAAVLGSASVDPTYLV
jgi:hypothetical protein